MLGFVDNSFQKAEEFGIKTYKYVTSGVLLINLKKLRKYNYTAKFFDFIEDK
jgi:lipopolysaccharide biosynthesis glycosyltransferase